MHLPDASARRGTASVGEGNGRQDDPAAPETRREPKRRAISVVSVRSGDRPAGAAAVPSPVDVTPAHLAERILKSRSAVEGERKNVTILFADIVGSTALVENLDPEDASERLDPALHAMIDAVHRFEGTVTRTQGDGIMALFGAPLAHEDHAVRAAFAGLAMQDTVGRLAAPGLAIRVGLHSGEVLIRSINSDLSVTYDAAGPAMHLAARMEGLCEAGRVRCSEATERLIQGFVRARELEPVTAKGFSEPVRTFELGRLPGTRTRWQVRAARGVTDLVGRTDELAALKRALDRAVRGDGQVVALAGEAGVGKSRLAHEFLAAIEGDDVFTIEAAALPEGRSVPYLATTQLLRTWLDVDPDDDSQRIVTRLRDRLQAVDPELLALLPAYAELLHVNPEDELWLRREPAERRSAIRRALKALLLRLAEDRPVVMVVEDLHWLDAETLGVLDALVESLGATRVLLIVTYRLEHEERWSAKSYFARRRLDPFDNAETAEFLDASLGSAPGLDAVKQHIAERAGGTPLFAEELINHLVEMGALSGKRGAYRATGSVDTIDIPQTVQTVIAARIDRLPPEAKDALQAAAIVGSQVPAPLLANATGVDEDKLSQVVAPLQQHGFLFETRIVPDTEYTFKHALVRDVARASVSRKRRRNLHQAIVSGIETRYHNRVERYLDQLAYHAERAEMWDRAAGYAERAARRALDLSAYGLCVRHLDNAIRALEQLPQGLECLRRAVELRLALRAPLGALGDIERMQERLGEAESLARELGDDATLAAVGVSQTFAFNYAGELAKARDTGVAGLDLARKAGDDELIVAGSYHLAQTHLWAGDYRQAIGLLEPVLDMARGRFREERIGTAGTTSVLILGMHGVAHAYLGRFADAEANIDEAIAIADGLERPYDRAIARWYKGLALSLVGEHNLAIPPLEAAMAQCEEAEITFLRPVVGTSLGFSYANTGRLEEAEAALETALAQYSRTGLRYGVAYSSLNLASAALQRGEHQRLSQYLAEATEVAVQCGFAGIEVAARRLQALAASSAGADSRDATRAATRALALAEEKGMGPDSAHCHLVLARLRGAEGDLGRAKRHAQMALSLYRELGMTRWLERAQKLLSNSKAG